MSRAVEETDLSLMEMEPGAREFSSDPKGISPDPSKLPVEKDDPIPDFRKLESKPGRDLNDSQAKPENEDKDCVGVGIDLDHDGKETEELVIESQLEKLPEVARSATAEIIKMMGNPRDLATLLEASPSFRSEVYRLSKNPENWLWKEVFTRQDFVDHFNATVKITKEFLAEFPQYKKVVDTFFGLVYTLQPDYKNCKFLQPNSQAPYFGPGNEEGQNWLWADAFRESISFDPSDQFASASVTSSPFVKGRLLYNYTGNVDFQPGPGYTDKVAKVLERFGEGVHSAIIKSPTTTLNSTLKTLLHRMPNLVALKVSLGDEEETESDMSSPQEVFPKLLDLVSLSIFPLNLKPSMSSILSPLSVYFEQITVLDVTGGEFMSFLDIYDPSTHPRFINLQSLSISISEPHHPNKFLAAFGGPDAVGLKRIKLDGCHIFPRFHFYLQLLEPFGSTLLLAEIEHDYGVDLPDREKLEGLFPVQRVGASHQFSFPVLRVLSITMEFDYMSLSRLRDLQGLGYLKLGMYNMDHMKRRPYRWRTFLELEEDLPEAPSLYDNLDDLNRSDIWKIIPSLNQIKLGIFSSGERVYNRERF